jgi:hypothetical protein
MFVRTWQVVFWGARNLFGAPKSLAETALALLYKLEKATKELVTINQQIIALTKEFEEKRLRL